MITEMPFLSPKGWVVAPRDLHGDYATMSDSLKLAPKQSDETSQNIVPPGKQK
jgi:hypothetical protein